MSEKYEVNTSGRVKISEEVIAAIAIVAASEVEGVKYLYGKKPQSVCKKAKKHVRMSFKDQQVTVDISIVIKYGYVIPDVGYAVQENVQKNIECMTGLRVAAINVHCSGIAFTKEEANRAAGD